MYSDMTHFIREDFFKEFQNAIDTALFDETPFGEQAAIKSVATFYDEFELERPKHYFIYEDAKTLYEKFDEWRNKVNGCVTSWEWNFPIIYPYSFWSNHIIKDNFDLTDKRKGPGLFVSNGQKLSSGVNKLPKTILKSMWEELGKFERLSEYTSLLEKEIDSIPDDDKFSGFLSGLLDETSQENPFDVFFIGTDFKLVYEVASCNYLKNTHNIRRNDSYINCINDMLKCCGLVLGFDNVSVICKKINYR